MFGRKKKDGQREGTPSVRENYAYNLIYQILTLLTPLITTPYIARVLGTGGVGIQSYTSSVVQYFSILAALGTASYGQREIARNRDDREARSRVFWEIELLCAALHITIGLGRDPNQLCHVLLLQMQLLTRCAKMTTYAPVIHFVNVNEKVNQALMKK